MTAKIAKAADLSVSLHGGPKAPASWKKWSKSGEVVREYFEHALEELGYKENFNLVGSTGVKGGRRKIVKLMQILSHKNGIEITAQLGDGLSRWKYELIAPKGTDVVELYTDLEGYVSSTFGENDSEVALEEAEVIDFDQENPLNKQEDVNSSTEGNADEDFDDSITHSSTSEFNHISSIQPTLQELSKLSAEYTNAAQSAKKNATEIEKIKREIAEREEMLRMYEEEQAEAETILSSVKHQTAKNKLQMIREILES